jgi:hypothetical protein
MGDHMNVVTRASGRVSSTSATSKTIKLQRYVGFSTGRLREGSGKLLTASDFFDWSAKLEEEINVGNSGSPLFGRFASPAGAPDDTQPLNVLFDLAQIAEHFHAEGSEDDGLMVEDACVDEDTSGSHSDGFSFSLSINGNLRNGRIKWDKERNKYIVTSAELEEFTSKDNDKVTLVKKLNQAQPFRIVTNTPFIVDAFGRFYNIKLQLDPKRGPGAAMLDLMTGVPGLASLGEEKGDVKAGDSTWPADSVFGLFDREVGPRKGNYVGAFGERFSTVICDDIGGKAVSETADFICMDAGRCVLAHLKAKNKGSKYGASNLYDVVGQATKNLLFIKPDSQEFPGDGSKWDNLWTDEGKGKLRRIRHGKGPGRKVREAFMEMRGRPSTRRQVWLVLGNILSKRSVTAEMSKANPQPESIQVYHLITSLHSACQSIGVELRIFCSP